MFDLSFKAAKEGFFDREKIMALADKAKVKNLSKMGSIVWKIAKRSIRKRKKSSAPGQQPSSHVGLLKDLIFFSYDSQKESVVIGPTLINKPTGAPKTLEYGGDTEIEEHQFRHRGGKTVYETIMKKIHILPRPYMGPAVEAGKPYFEKIWENSIK